MAEKSNWQAAVYVKWNKQWPKKWSQKKSWDWLKDWKQVTAAWSTMGDWDMVLWVDVKSPEELEKFVCEKLWSQDWVEATESQWARQVWEAA